MIDLRAFFITSEDLECADMITGDIGTRVLITGGIGTGDMIAGDISMSAMSAGDVIAGDIGAQDIDADQITDVRCVLVLEVSNLVVLILEWSYRYSEAEHWICIRSR